ncbi:MAG: response regulator [Eubacterium sp.]|nr:response regulator [Eubacterium sp.]
MSEHKIMIIEDEVNIGNMLQEALEMEKYSVLRAYSGTEALMFLEKEKPNLVLLDLMLPGLSGEEVLPKLNGIPTIVTSAKTRLMESVHVSRTDVFFI